MRVEKALRLLAEERGWTVAERRTSGGAHGKSFVVRTQDGVRVNIGEPRGRNIGQLEKIDSIVSAARARIAGGR